MDSVYRDRLTDLGRASDLAGAPGRRTAAARRLVKVTTGGTLPTCTPCVYLGNPVELDGAEIAGGSATPLVDTSKTVPFVLLSGKVAIGDILPIHSAGGRWAAHESANNCASRPITICVNHLFCGGPGPAVGAVIDLYSGSNLVASCVTGSTGCCQFTVPPGPYTVTVTVDGAVVISRSISVVCGGRFGLGYNTPGPPNSVCCDGCWIPENLTLTDGNGTHAFTYTCGTDACWWLASYAVPKPNCITCPDANPCCGSFGFECPQTCLEIAADDVIVCYSAQCMGTPGGPQLAMRAGWGIGYYNPSFAGCTAPCVHICTDCDCPTEFGGFDAQCCIEGNFGGPAGIPAYSGASLGGGCAPSIPFTVPVSCGGGNVTGGGSFPCPVLDAGTGCGVTISS